MIRGLFRTTDAMLGDCVRVDKAAGDAAPLLRNEIYIALGGSPRLEELPYKGPLRERVWEGLLEPA